MTRRDRPSRRHLRGALLLEVMLALALLVTASSLVVGVIRDSSDRIERAIDMGVAADLAHTAIAQIETNLATPETLTGPTPNWTLADEFDAATGPARSSDDIAIESSSPVNSEWAYQIETQTTPFDGLTLISVSVLRDEAARATYTLHQLTRLEAPNDDEIGDEDEMEELIREVNESVPESDEEDAP